MTHNRPKLLFVVKDEARKTFYCTVLNAFNIACRIVDSLQEAIVHASEEPYCGLLVDIQLMLKINNSLKDDVENLYRGLPSATINFNVVSGSVRILPRGTKSVECSSLNDFITVCTKHYPKIIFQRNRHPIHFNVLIDLNPEFTNPYKTACIDISSGGCFLFCTREDIFKGSTVWIRMPDEVSDTPINGVVCWVRDWGTSRKLPGIGVSFTDRVLNFNNNY